MKSTFNWVYKTLMVVAGIVALTACSSEKGSEDGPKEFPAFKDISARVGDEGTIDFTAYGVWTISSDKQWFVLSPTTGVAGAQKVKYTVTDDGLGFTDDTATATFEMDGRKVSIKVTRTAKDRELTLFTAVQSEEGMVLQETSVIELTYLANAGNYAGTFAVRTNFDWKLTVPEWISIDEDFKSGDANPDEEKPGYKWIYIEYSKATLDDMSGDLVFADAKDPEAKFVKTITAPGSKNYMLSSASIFVELTHDGMYTDAKTGEVINGYPFTITAGTGNVTFFKVWSDGKFYGVDPTGSGNLQYTAPWCDIDPSTNKIIGPAVTEFGYELWCQQNDDNVRQATILAIPTAKAVGLTEKDLVADGDEEIKPEYQQYIVTDLKQTIASGLSFVYGQYLTGITLRKMADGDEADAIKSEQGVTMVYELIYESFETAGMAEMKFTGYDSDELSYDVVPGSAQLTADSGWIGLEIATNLMVSISDEFVPYPNSQRDAIIVIKSKKVNVLALKVTQKCARAN